jgi:hypothetical protein
LSCSTVIWGSNRRSERVSGEVTKTVTVEEDMILAMDGKMQNATKTDLHQKRVGRVW